MARGRATAEAAGVDVSSGTPLLLQLNNARQAEMEALNIRRTGAIRAAQYKMTTDYLGPLATGAARGGSILTQWLKDR